MQEKCLPTPASSHFTCHHHLSWFLLLNEDADVWGWSLREENRSLGLDALKTLCPVRQTSSTWAWACPALPTPNCVIVSRAFSAIPKQGCHQETLPDSSGADIKCWSWSSSFQPAWSPRHPLGLRGWAEPCEHTAWAPWVL